MEQNVKSTFSLANDYNLSVLDSGIEDKINEKIN